jgi:ankyrin repeat protein
LIRQWLSSPRALLALAKCCTNVDAMLALVAAFRAPYADVDFGTIADFRRQGEAHDAAGDAVGRAILARSWPGISEGAARELALLAVCCGDVDGWQEHGSVTNAQNDLHTAASCGQGGMVAALLATGACDVTDGPDGFFPLYVCASKGTSAGVAALLAAGADVNQRDRRGQCSALWIAAQEGHCEVVRCLLAAGADPNLGSHIWGSPLAVASHGNHTDVVALLTDAGASPE